MDISIKQLAGVIIAIAVLGAILAFTKGDFADKMEDLIDQQITEITTF